MGVAQVAPHEALVETPSVTIVGCWTGVRYMPL
jgi:hypothetical protein